MINYFKKIATTISSKDTKIFGILLTTILFFLFLYRLFYFDEYLFLLFPISIISLTFLLPNFIKIFFVFWKGVTSFIGKIVLIFLLAILFYCLITPISIFMRIIGKKRLNIELNQNKTYWIRRKYLVSDFKKMY